MYVCKHMMNVCILFVIFALCNGFNFNTFNTKQLETCTNNHQMYLIADIIYINVSFILRNKKRRAIKQTQKYIPNTYYSIYSCVDTIDQHTYLCISDEKL